MRIEAAISECRGLMSDLTPPLLYEVGLATALKGFASRQAELNQIEIEVEAEGFSDTLCDSLKGMLFQSARELVMNAMKHADPSRVLIRLSSFDSRLALEVIDDGDGFDSDDTDLFDADDSGGFGLFNIRERVSSVGGGIELESTPKQGTKARIEVPV